MYKSELVKARAEKLVLREIEIQSRLKWVIFRLGINSMNILKQTNSSFSNLNNYLQFHSFSSNFCPNFTYRKFNKSPDIRIFCGYTPGFMMTRKFSWPSSWLRRGSCISIYEVPTKVAFQNVALPITRIRWPMPSTTVIWTTWFIAIWNRKIFCWPAVINSNWLILDGRRTPNRINVKLCVVHSIICHQKCKYTTNNNLVVGGRWFRS